MIEISSFKYLICHQCLIKIQKDGVIVQAMFRKLLLTDDYSEMEKQDRVVGSRSTK